MKAPTNSEEAKGNFKSFVRRMKYHSAALGLFAHSCVTQMVFSRSGAGKEAIGQYFSADLLGLVVGFVLCAALIETTMLVLERRMKDD